MTVLEYNQFGEQTLVFNLQSFTDTGVPYYVSGNATIAWFPLAGRPFKLKKVDFVGHLSAAGTGVSLRANVYKASVAAGNIGLSCATVATDDAGDISATSSAASNTSTAKDNVTESDGIIVAVLLAAGDTFTCDRSAVYVTIAYL